MIVLCFGELLLRLSPDREGRWISDHSMPVFIGGAELNVANALARWKVPVAYCSAVPANYLSANIITSLDHHGINTDRIIKSGDRIGIYYLAQGTDLKNAEVIYDRANSSTTDLVPGKINWDKVLEDVDWFHFSAITPAISKNLADVCHEALESAARKGITISVDLNYRAKLWMYGKEPVQVMPRLVNYCNIVMGNIWAAETMLGIAIGKDFKKDKDNCLLQSAQASEELINRFPQCRQVANTFRFDQGEKLQYYATLYSNNRLYVSQEHTASNIVDKVGSGDCFMAGLIYGNVNELNMQQTLEFATAAAVDKLFIMGDATTSEVEDIRMRVENAQQTTR